MPSCCIDNDEVSPLGLEGGRVEMKIECDGGLSVRKFITGENGEVTPNISETLGIPVSLDENMPFDILTVKLK